MTAQGKLYKIVSGNSFVNVPAWKTNIVDFEAKFSTESEKFDIVYDKSYLYVGTYVLVLFFPDLTFPEITDKDPTHLNDCLQSAFAKILFEDQIYYVHWWNLSELEEWEYAKWK